MHSFIRGKRDGLTFTSTSAWDLIIAFNVNIFFLPQFSIHIFHLLEKNSAFMSFMKISSWMVGLFTGVWMKLHSGFFSDTVLYFDVKKTLLISIDYTTEYTLCGCVTSCQLPSLFSFSSLFILILCICCLYYVSMVHFMHLLFVLLTPDYSLRRCRTTG